MPVKPFIVCDSDGLYDTEECYHAMIALDWKRALQDGRLERLIVRVEKRSGGDGDDSDEGGELEDCEEVLRAHAELVYSNLGRHGPDDGKGGNNGGIRYANVGSTLLPAVVLPKIPPRPSRNSCFTSPRQRASSAAFSSANSLSG